LKPANEIQTFNEFALTEGFQCNQYGDKTHQEKWEMEIVGNNLIFPLISSNFL